MEILTGKKVFNLIELDTDLGNSVSEVYVETYNTKEKAQQALKNQLNVVKAGLIDEGQKLIVDDFGYYGDSLFSGTLKTVNNYYDWKIQENSIL